ncbi:NAD(P)-binding protein, partial [Pluteus cervinus]
MASVLQNLTYLQEYAYSWLRSAPKKEEHPLKIGILSTADINSASIIHPAEMHPDVVLYAIASRDVATAKSYAKKYGFQKFFGSYEELLNDAEVDFVYISLPNSMHYEWALKAIEAGKPALVEKPFTDNHEEAIKLVQTAKKKNIILMEAFHWQFHPAAHLFREILNEEDEGGEGEGSVGKIMSTEAWMTTTPWIPKKDIRWKYDLGGGSLMDDTYVLSFTRFALNAGSPHHVITAKARLDKDDPRVDAAMNSTLLFESSVNAPKGEEYEVHCSIYTDFQRAWAFHLIPRVWELPSIKVETEKKIIFFYNAMMPHLYHFISITDKKTGKTQYK